MKFNSQICTTEEQSKRLLDLGLKAETADMGLAGDIPIAIEDWKTQDTTLINYPAWSLHRLIELLGLSKICFNIDLYDSPYEEVIHRIDIFINSGEFNKEYLE